MKYLNVREFVAWTEMFTKLYRLEEEIKKRMGVSGCEF